jgi:dTDP-4-amino-4,6-dideoxygalactose transaminase
VLRIPFYDCTPSLEHAQILVHAAEEVVRGGDYVGGELVQEFENQLSDYLGGGYCVGVGNGLDALTLSLMALNVGPGDEVIVPTHSFIATWIAVSRCGATSVGVDVNPTTGLVDLDQVLKKVTRKTKVFLPVQLYGAPVDFSGIQENLKDRGVFIVEDCAQALGAKTASGMAGTLGDLGAFSFYPTKNLGALGDGGAIFTRNKEMAERLKSLRSYGIRHSRYEFSELGLNSRLDPIQAAFLSKKLPLLDAEGEYRNWQAEIYTLAIGDGGLKPVAAEQGYSVYHHFAALSDDRIAFRQRMYDLGVDTDTHYPYTIEAFTNLSKKRTFRVKESDLTGSRELAAKVVTFPMGTWLSREQTLAVADRISKALG